MSFFPEYIVTIVTSGLSTVCTEIRINTDHVLGQFFCLNIHIMRMNEAYLQIILIRNGLDTNRNVRLTSETV